MVILTPKSTGVTTAVTLGQVVQAQLPNNRNWVYMGQTNPLLTPMAPSGERTSGGVYLWTFRAQASGSTTLHFTGKVVCQANVPCTPLAFALSFALHVTA
jgi:predicted secreted protein